jgi:hypothetical protein
MKWAVALVEVFLVMRPSITEYAGCSRFIASLNAALLKMKTAPAVKPERWAI